VPQGVYVVSLFVYAEEDDPGYSTVTVGLLTETQVGVTTGDASDADETWRAGSDEMELAVAARCRLGRDAEAGRTGVRPAQPSR
jgi:hypothetical protein